MNYILLSLKYLDFIIIKLQHFFKLIFQFVIMLLSKLIIKPFTPRLGVETRNTNQIVFIPFVNSINFLKDSLTLLTKGSLILSLLSLYKFLLSLFLAILFFIMYLTAYTYVGLFIYQLVVILAISVFKYILSDNITNEDGVYTKTFLTGFITFVFLIFMFSLFWSSSVLISHSAKIIFLRDILIKTVGSLSYKLYVGENSGTEATGVTILGPRLIATGFVMASGAVLLATLQGDHQNDQIEKAIARGLKEGHENVIIEERIRFMRETYKQNDAINKLGKAVLDIYTGVFGTFFDKLINGVPPIVDSLKKVKEVSELSPAMQELLKELKKSQQQNLELLAKVNAFQEASQAAEAKLRADLGQTNPGLIVINPDTVNTDIDLSLRSAPNQVGSRGAPPQLPIVAAEAEIRDKPTLLSRKRLSSAGDLGN